MDTRTPEQRWAQRRPVKAVARWLYGRRKTYHDTELAQAWLDRAGDPRRFHHVLKHWLAVQRAAAIGWARSAFRGATT